MQFPPLRQGQISVTTEWRINTNHNNIMHTCTDRQNCLTTHSCMDVHPQQTCSGHSEQHLVHQRFTVCMSRYIHIQLCFPCMPIAMYTYVCNHRSTLILTKVTVLSKVACRTAAGLCQRTEALSTIQAVRRWSTAGWRDGACVMVPNITICTGTV